ncbi:hypothetical protein AMTR_s00002p00129370 [Amborella trichopoda]|uniref:Uncharacterized protein n=1 Tax=Amborella trichopoda TaxID=13333 RepID=W1P0C5_AMBTC|nr:hypothetical protein AMTR_s00002p00129370 [Amborella trichopoda]
MAAQLVEERYWVQRRSLLFFSVPKEEDGEALPSLPLLTLNCLGQITRVFSA